MNLRDWPKGFAAGHICYMDITGGATVSVTVMEIITYVYVFIVVPRGTV
jgi:hypothetical protein